MKKSVRKTVPFLAKAREGTITGRPFLESGWIGRFCLRLPTEGFLSLLHKLHPDTPDDELLKSCVSSIVRWYRYNGSPRFWTNGPLIEWLESLSLPSGAWNYSLYAALLLCVDRAVARGLRGKEDEAEQWFDCAQWLRFSLAMEERESPAATLARLRHAENYALAEFAINYWRENINPTLSAEKAASKMIQANAVDLGHKKIAALISAEKKKLKQEK